MRPTWSGTKALRTIAVEYRPLAFDVARGTPEKPKVESRGDLAAGLREADLVLEEIVLSGVGPIPWRSREAEAMLAGASATEDGFEAAARAALQAASPLRHNGYKVPLAKALLKRALRTLSDAYRIG